MPCIRRAALLYRQSLPLMLSIVRCESGFNPGNVNPSSGASGLAQFLLSTWRSDTRYGRAGHEVLSAKWNALGFAEVLRSQGTQPWVSSRSCWG